MSTRQMQPMSGQMSQLTPTFDKRHRHSKRLLTYPALQVYDPTHRGQGYAICPYNIAKTWQERWIGKRFESRTRLAHTIQDGSYESCKLKTQPTVKQRSIPTIQATTFSSNMYKKCFRPALCGDTKRPQIFFWNLIYDALYISTGHVVVVNIAHCLTLFGTCRSFFLLNVWWRWQLNHVKQKVSDQILSRLDCSGMVRWEKRRFLTIYRTNSRVVMAQHRQTWMVPLSIFLLPKRKAWLWKGWTSLTVQS